MCRCIDQARTISRFTSKTSPQLSRAFANVQKISWSRYRSKNDLSGSIHASTSAQPQPAEVERRVYQRSTLSHRIQSHDLMSSLAMPMQESTFPAGVSYMQVYPQNDSHAQSASPFPARSNALLHQRSNKNQHVAAGNIKQPAAASFAPQKPPDSSPTPSQTPPVPWQHSAQTAPPSPPRSYS